MAMNGVELITSEWEAAFQQLLSSAKRELLLVSPFVGQEPLHYLGRALSRVNPPPRVCLLLNAAPENLLSGSVDARALRALISTHPHIHTAHLGNLHAKAYVQDSEVALVTSANFTTGGWRRNRELGVRIQDAALVDQIRSHILSLFGVATKLNVDDWDVLSEVVSSSVSPRPPSPRETHVISSRLQEARLRQIAPTGRVSENQVFAKTILFLLEHHGPLTTEELHPLVQELHPELCDDRVDRVIRGVHFGKRWKHMVRNAQQYLKRRGRIAYDRATRKWHLV